MPATRGTTNRAEQYKRQLVGVLMDTTNNNHHHNSGNNHHANTTKTTMAVDGTDKNHISMMLEDLQIGLKKRLDAIQTDMLTCKQEQLQAHRSGMMKIPKATREMTIADFNTKYQCNLLDVLQTAKVKATSSGGGKKMACGKRDRAFETPAPNRRLGPQQAPTGTILRTVRRGEALYSKNGSPVDPIDEGALVATVTKKRRGNNANFDINVGEGRYISLNDPNGVQHLDDNMKSNALTQLKVLQDQMASLMEQLTTKDHGRK